MLSEASSACFTQVTFYFHIRPLDVLMKFLHLCHSFLISFAMLPSGCICMRVCCWPVSCVQSMFLCWMFPACVSVSEMHTVVALFMVHNVGSSHLRGRAGSKVSHPSPGPQTPASTHPSRSPAQKPDSSFAFVVSPEMWTFVPSSLCSFPGLPLLQCFQSM